MQRSVWFVLIAFIAAACGSSTALPEVNDQRAIEQEVVDDEVVEPVGLDESSADSVDEPAATSDDQAIEEAAFSSLCDADPAPLGSRVDISETGNRIGAGSLDFVNGREFQVELPDNGVWITADPAIPGGWYVVLERGSAVRVSPEGEVTSADAPGAVPPDLDVEGTARSPFTNHDLFVDPITDGRVVMSDNIAVALSTPTDFYRHGVLGDALEAAAIEWVDTCTGEAGRIDIAEPDVIEGLSPMLADIDSDGQFEVLVTLSNSDEGSRLAAFELDGTTAGESEPIGQGNRWRNQLAVGAFGPNGEVEIIDVRTPHIGGTVQAFQQVRDDETGLSLVQVAASDARYTSHVNGDRNLSMGIAVDADGDEFPDVLVATSDRNAIVAMARTADLDAELQGWDIIGERPLTNGLTSNIATQEERSGLALVAVSDGDTLRIWSN